MKQRISFFVWGAMLLCLSPSRAFAWHDLTHMAVAKAAGIGNYAYLAVAPDVAKEKAGDLEGNNHFHNTPKNVEITPELVLAQVREYNDAHDGNGHLYGAVIASLDDYLIAGAGGKYAFYPLGYAAHYIGDLSMPFHNTSYNSFNKENHAANDGVVETTGPANESTDGKVARLAAEIQKRMKALPPRQISTDIGRFHRDLATGIAAIANRAKDLGYEMETANPPRPRMTEEEAYTQLARSAQLLKAAYTAMRR